MTMLAQDVVEFSVRRPAEISKKEIIKRLKKRGILKEKERKVMGEWFEATFPKGGFSYPLEGYVCTAPFSIFCKVWTKSWIMNDKEKRKEKEKIKHHIEAELMELLKAP